MLAIVWGRHFWQFVGGLRGVTAKAGAEGTQGEYSMPTKANPVDIHVGARVKLRRQLLGFSQTELGNALDLTFQQVQKYEKGTNRISASKLHKMAEVLDVPISFFFDGVEGAKRDSDSGDLDMMSRAETINLVRAYYSIDDDAVRRKVIELLRTLGREVPAED
nr:helix-turn-helix transcriptional regulator [Oleomonas cavernae]